MSDFDDAYRQALEHVDANPGIAEIRDRAASKCPRYSELAWDDVSRLFDQICLVAMTAGWKPGLEVAIISRYPPNVQTSGRLILMAMPTVLNEAYVVAHLRELQAKAAELAELHAVWLHILAPGEEHTMSYWHGTDPSTIHHVALEAS